MSASSIRQTTDFGTTARQWFVEMLDEHPEPARVAGWETWLSESPDHQAAYDEVAAAWALAEDAPLASPSAEELDRDDYDGRIAIASWRRRKPNLTLVAGGVAVAAFATVAFVIARQSAARREAGVVPPKGRAKKKA